MQSADAAGRAGVTKFAELTGELGAADERASFRNLNLQGGVLRGNGSHRHRRPTAPCRAGSRSRSAPTSRRTAAPSP